jgi:hypothetical protein
VHAVADLFMYADETGDLDLAGTAGASRYFGFGTAVFTDGHGKELWEGLQLRCDLESRGVRLPRGFHAKNDSHATRSEVFALIQARRPRFDTTFLLKANAYRSIREAGPVRLYKVAWYLHFKEIARQVSQPGDRLFVIVGSLQTNNKRDAIRHALEDVCAQVDDRTIVPCIWDAPSSWGIQVADYGLWAVQRKLEGRACSWFDPCVKPGLRSIFTPWGRA